MQHPSLESRFRYATVAKCLHAYVSTYNVRIHKDANTYVFCTFAHTCCKRQGCVYRFSYFLLPSSHFNIVFPFIRGNNKYVVRLCAPYRCEGSPLSERFFFIQFRTTLISKLHTSAHTKRTVVTVRYTYPYRVFLVASTPIRTQTVPIYEGEHVRP